MRDYGWSPCDYYEAYCAERDEAARALTDWWTAPAALRCEAHAVYRAAVEREDAAALAFLHACREYDSQLAA